MKIPIIQSPKQWRKESYKRLKLSFDALRDARQALLDHKLLKPEWDTVFNEMAQRLLYLGKEINNQKDEKPV